MVLDNLSLGKIEHLKTLEGDFKERMDFFKGDIDR